jgi:hypothetical protein
MKFLRVLHLRFLGLTLLAVALTGCGNGPPPIAVVRGRVTFEGRPLAKVRVEFNPELPTGDRYLRSLATTDDNGEFELLCDNGDKGATVGWHKVVLASDSRSAERLRNPFEPESGRDGPSPSNPGLIPRAYNSVATTPERQEVKAGTENRFELKVTRR